MKMKKLLALLLAFAMCFCFVACGKKEGSSNKGDGKTIKIGLVEPLTGSSASLGANQVAGIKYALQDYVKHYGNPGGYEIELVVGDSQGSADVGVTEAERLITEEKVQALMGTYNSGVAQAVAPIAIKYEIPFMVVNAVADGILSEDSNYCFRANSCDTVGANLGKTYMEYLNEQCKIQKGRECRFGFLWDTGDWGSSNSQTTIMTCEEGGYNIVFKEGIETGTSDLSTVITKMKAADIDYLYQYIFLDEAVLLARQCKEQNFVIVGGGGGGYIAAEYINALGADADYFMGVGSYVYDPTVLSKEALDIADDFVKNTTGAVAVDEPFNNGWLGMYILCHAINNAKSNDPKKIAEAMDAIELDSTKGEERAFLFNPLMTHVKFEDIPAKAGGTVYNQNPDATVAYTQIKDGNYHAIYPGTELKINLCPPAWNER